MCLDVTLFGGVRAEWAAPLFFGFVGSGVYCADARRKSGEKRRGAETTKTKTKNRFRNRRIVSRARSFTRHSSDLGLLCQLAITRSLYSPEAHLLAMTRKQVPNKLAVPIAHFLFFRIIRILNDPTCEIKSYWSSRTTELHVAVW